MSKVTERKYTEGERGRSKREERLERIETVRRVGRRERRESADEIRAAVRAMMSGEVSA